MHFHVLLSALEMDDIQREGVILAHMLFTASCIRFMHHFLLITNDVSMKS